MERWETRVDFPEPWMPFRAMIKGRVGEVDWCSLRRERMKGMQWGDLSSNIFFCEEDEEVVGLGEEVEEVEAGVDIVGYEGRVEKRGIGIGTIDEDSTREKQIAFIREGTHILKS